MARMSAKLLPDINCYSYNMNTLEDLCAQFCEATGYGGDTLDSELLKLACALSDLERMSVNFRDRWHSQGGSSGKGYGGMPSKEGKDRERKGRPEEVNPRSTEECYWGPRRKKMPAMSGKWTRRMKTGDDTNLTSGGLKTRSACNRKRIRPSPGLTSRWTTKF